VNKVKKERYFWPKRGTTAERVSGRPLKIEMTMRDMKMRDAKEECHKKIKLIKTYD